MVLIGHRPRLTSATTDNYVWKIIIDRSQLTDTLYPHSPLDVSAANQSSREFPQVGSTSWLTGRLSAERSDPIGPPCCRFLIQWAAWKTRLALAFLVLPLERTLPSPQKCDYNSDILWKPSNSLHFMLALAFRLAHSGGRIVNKTAPLSVTQTHKVSSH